MAAIFLEFFLQLVLPVILALVYGGITADKMNKVRYGQASWVDLILPLLIVILSIASAVNFFDHQ
jgi:uncharacterized membrane protein